jgi:hypothetical protein
MVKWRMRSITSITSASASTSDRGSDARILGDRASASTSASRESGRSTGDRPSCDTSSARTSRKGTDRVRRECRSSRKTAPRLLRQTTTGGPKFWPVHLLAKAMGACLQGVCGCVPPGRALHEHAQFGCPVFATDSPEESAFDSAKQARVGFKEMENSLLFGLIEIRHRDHHTKSKFSSGKIQQPIETFFSKGFWGNQRCCAEFWTTVYCFKSSHHVVSKWEVLQGATRGKRDDASEESSSPE